MAFNLFRWLNVARVLDRLFSLGTKLTALVETQDREILELKERLTRLEACEQVLIAEAKGAAAAAASVVASQHVADLARHLGTLDERTRRLIGPLAGNPDHA